MKICMYSVHIKYGVLRNIFYMETRDIVVHFFQNGALFLVVLLVQFVNFLMIVVFSCIDDREGRQNNENPSFFKSAVIFSYLCLQVVYVCE